MGEKVYVVMRSGGEYENRFDDATAVYAHREDAERHVEYMTIGRGDEAYVDEWDVWGQFSKARFTKAGYLRASPPVVEDEG